MYRFLRGIIATIAFLILVHLALSVPGSVLFPVFDLADGDGDILALFFVIFAIVILAATWVWSARSRRPRPIRS